MTTIRNTPASEVHIVADQNQQFNAMSWRFLDNKTSANIDLTPYDIRVQVRDGNNGPLMLEWSTDDGTITTSASETDNPESVINEATMAIKTALQMNIAAKSYVWKWEMRVPESDWVKYMFGNFIINP